MTTIRFDQVSKMFRRRHAEVAESDLWALRDVSFECQAGEVVGLLGRNGCGKSTLLKLAARVTAATSGTVLCVAPVAPMLELGAGFHPDLTGRDNIRLNGSLLGLGKNIGAALLDEIVAFAEVEEHIDTPVKHYSSGMYARLGFAVAVHSPARVLLVDEVLSVGDQLFRRKCLARMEHLRDRGVTILLVSHDTWAIRNFCGRALVMDQGRLIADAQPEKALQVYEWSLRGFARVNALGVSICRIDVLGPGGEPLHVLAGDSLRVCLSYDATQAPQARSFVVRVRREDGVCCAACVKTGPERRKGTAIADIGGLHLAVGRYVVEVAIEDETSLSPVTIEVSAPFQVVGPFDQKRGYSGVIKIRDAWSFS